MATAPIVDVHSLCTVPVETFFDGQSFATATAFVWERRTTVLDDRHGFFLITNWHVVSGRNSRNGRHLKTHAGEPNTLKCLFCETGPSMRKVSRDIRLRDDLGRPTWLVHPIHRNEVDVVAIELPPPDREVKYVPANQPENPGEMKVGMDVFVLGYPFGAPPPSLPVWKRGSIASEPQMVGNNQRYLLVDTASRPGMSGAPVIWLTHGPVIGHNSKFVGVYSGRLHTKDESDAQIGIVWPPQLIEQIVEGKTRDDPSGFVFNDLA